MTRIVPLLPINIKIYLTIILACLCAQTSWAEGSRQLERQAGAETKLSIGRDRIPNFATYTSDPLYRLYIRVANVSEKIYLGFGISHQDVAGQDTVRTLYYRIKAPNGTIIRTGSLVPTKKDDLGFIENVGQSIGPKGLTGFAGGYDPIVVDNLPSIGDYYIEFSKTNTNLFNTGGLAAPVEQQRAVFEFFDITVGDGTSPKPGRLWSNTWQLLAPGENVETRSEFYVYTTDSVVTRLGLNGMRPMGFTVMCNQLGTNSSTLFEESRMSVPNQQAGYPEYKIFLNDPDLLEFPSYKQPISLTSTELNGCTQQGYCIGVKYNLTKKIKAEVTLDFNGDGMMDAEDRLLTYDLEAGFSCIPWDGKDNLGNNVPPSSQVLTTIRVLTGLTNFPIFDAEENPNGLIVELIRPQIVGGVPVDNAAPKPLEIFWDDTKFPTRTNPLSPPTGCLADGSNACQTWNKAIGDEATMNAWWNVLDATSTETLSNDQVAKIDAGPPQKVCSNNMTVGVQLGTAPGADALPADDYSWRVIRGAPAFEGNDPNLRQPTVTLNNATDDTVHYEVTVTRNGCTAKDSTYIYKLLTQGPKVTGFQSVCPGVGGVSYVAVDQLAKSFTWSVTNGIATNYPDEIGRDSIIVQWNNSPGGSGTVTVTSNYEDCGTLFTSLPITIENTLAAPVPVGDRIVCQSATEIHTFEAPYSPNYEYLWNTNGSFEGTPAQWSGLGKNKANILFPNSGNIEVFYRIRVPGTCNNLGLQGKLIVQVNPKPFITAKTHEICSDEKRIISFTGNPVPNTQYQWAPTFGLSAYNIPNPETRISSVTLQTFQYAVTATNQFNCSFTDNVTVTVYPKPIPLGFTGPTEICEESITPGSLHTFTLRSRFADPPSWRFNNSSTPTNIPVNADENSVTVTIDPKKLPNTLAYRLKSSKFPNNQDCEVNETKDITFKKLIVYTPFQDQTICINPGIGVHKVFRTNGSTYDWRPENGTMLSQDTNAIEVQWDVNAPAGSHKLAVYQTGFDNYECKVIPPQEKNKLLVNLVDFVSVTENPDVNICLGDSLKLKAQTVGDPKFISWKPINAPGAPFVDSTLEYKYLPTQITPVGSPAQFEVTFDNGCKDIKMTSVNIYPVPGDPIEPTRIVFCTDNQESDTIVTRQDSPSQGPYNYKWDPLGDFEPIVVGDSSSIIVQKEQEYTLTIYNSFGCFAYDTVMVRDLCPPRIFVPKAITPDAARDPERNDVLKIFGANFINFKMRIFNRWGEVIYESTDREESWDGTYNGQPVPFGVYPYVISYDSEFEKDNENPRQHTGSVTVIR